MPRMVTLPMFENEDSKMKQDKKEKWSYQQWYENNKEKLSQKRKDKYQKDPKHRAKVLKQNDISRAKKALDKPFKMRSRLPKKRKPLLVKAFMGDAVQEATMVHIGDFSKSIKRSIATIYKWEKAGLLPRTPFFLSSKSKQERLYTAGMIDVVKKSLSTRLNVSLSDLRFREEIVAGWKLIGVSIEGKK